MTVGDDVIRVRGLTMGFGDRVVIRDLDFGVRRGEVYVVMGPSGCGKTTLLRAALESERCRAVQCVYLTNPALTREEFVGTLARSFGLSPEASGSKALMLEELERLLLVRSARGEITSLVLDEAQSMSTSLLEEVRLLANIETDTRKLLPLVLVGQPELALRLEEPELRQLKQRVALRCEIGPLEMAETAAYMAARIRFAGGEAARLFTREAVMASEGSYPSAISTSIRTRGRCAGSFRLMRVHKITGALKMAASSLTEFCTSAVSTISDGQCMYREGIERQPARTPERMAWMADPASK